MHKRALGAVLPCGLKQVERSDRVGIKIIERNCCSSIVRRLSGSMHNGLGLQLCHHCQNRCSVAYVQLHVNEGLAQLCLQTRLVPTGITSCAEEHGSLVVIDAINLPTTFGEVVADL